MAETQTQTAKKKHDIREWQATLTPEERKECALRAARKSGEGRAKRKLMRETLGDLLRAPIGDEELEAQLRLMGLPPNNQGAMLFAAMRKAMTGDIEAARFVRDTIGEKPTEQYNLSVSDKPIQALNLAEYSDQQLLEMAEKVEELPPTSG